MPPRANWIGAVCIALALAWAYWPTLVGLTDKWSLNPQYTHGYLVPVFAVALLWMRRRGRPNLPPSPCVWGVAILAFAAGLRLAAGYIYWDWLEEMALLISIAGATVLVGGMAAWRWARPAILFLVFMVPLPFQLEVALSRPLQLWATNASTYCLQTLGVPALAEGNVIIVDDLHVGVLEACNGLGMLMTFFTLATALVLVVRRPRAEVAVILASALPIALVVNVFRITAMALLHQSLGTHLANLLFHDLAGWLMMPVALALLMLELRLLASLWLEEEDTGPIPVVPKSRNTVEPKRISLREPCNATP